jgi:hypothetical protein
LSEKKKIFTWISTAVEIAADRIEAVVEKPSSNLESGDNIAFPTRHFNAFFFRFGRLLTRYKSNICGMTYC